MAFLDTTRLVGLLFGVHCTIDTEYTSMDFQSRFLICLRCDVCFILALQGSSLHGNYSTTICGTAFASLLKAACLQ
jgi:hypothetical protein